MSGSPNVPVLVSSRQPTSKGTLTTNTIDGREYYYLQWREVEHVKSQYVGPVEPA